MQMCAWTAVNANAKRRRRRLNFKARLMHSSATKATKFDELSAYKLPPPPSSPLCKIATTSFDFIIARARFNDNDALRRSRSRWRGEQVDVEGDKPARMRFVDGNAYNHRLSYILF